MVPWPLTAPSAASPARQEWKSKYVDSFVPIAGSFAGSLQSLRMVLAGYLWGINSKSLPWIDGSILAEVSRTFGGVTWSFPTTVPGHRDDWTVVETSHRAWKASEILQMLHEVDLHTTADIYNSTKGYQTFDPPGVTTYCLYGAGLPTPETLRYASEDVYDPAMLGYEEADGDGAVLLDSLNVCDLWAEEDPKMYTVVRLTNASHVQTVHRAEKYVRAIAAGNITKLLRKLGADFILSEEEPEAQEPYVPHATEGDGLTIYVQGATIAAVVLGAAVVAPGAMGLAAAWRLWARRAAMRPAGTPGPQSNQLL